MPLRKELRRGDRKVVALRAQDPITIVLAVDEEGLPESVSSAPIAHLGAEDVVHRRS
jgi:hypothetical protein